jgi:predicted RNase H-like nuclease (RuvC/YqgF family)
MQAYNEYARDAAREAIHRHNDHIEQCNRVIEASETRTWIDNDELGALKAEVQRWKGEAGDLERDNKRLQQKIDNLSATIDAAEGPPSAAAAGGPDSTSRILPEHLERINQLERELNEERKKNERVKGTPLHARDH